MKNVKILPYNRGSEGARALATALDSARLRLEGSTLKGRKNITIINWGATAIDNPEITKCTILNKPEEVVVHSDKLKFFRKYSQIEEVKLVPWTSDKAVVRNWLVEGSSVIARTKLNGHSGAGIVILRPGNPQEWVEAPLYTKYTKKKSEFRVHFLGGEIIDTQKKALKQGFENPNWEVRNLDNGFIFAREFGEVPPVVTQVAQAFVNNTTLDFGALDIIYNERSNEAFILEVNTAPGLAGTTVEKYKSAFERLIQNEM